METIKKRSFVRALWGFIKRDDIVPTHEQVNDHMWNRAPIISDDIKLSMANPYTPKSKVYVFGEENYKILVDMGLDCVLVDKKPFIYDMEKEQYRHKIEVWRCALQDFDEIVFLDWDEIALRPIPNDFWDVLSKGQPIKSSIIRYKWNKVPERGWHDRKITSHAAFVYIRGIEHANGVIKKWEDTGRPWYEEPALSLYIDQLNGGWKGIKDYYTKYEPEYCSWCIGDHTSDYVKNIMIPNYTFLHYKKRSIQGMLKGVDKNNSEQMSKVMAERVDGSYKYILNNLENYLKEILKSEKV